MLLISRRVAAPQTFTVRAKSIIFAGGPFVDGLRQLEEPEAPPAVAGAAGTHVVLPGYYCPSGMGMLDINTSDGRFLFFLPWEGSTLVGTTDVKVRSMPREMEPPFPWTCCARPVSRPQG